MFSVLLILLTIPAGSGCLPDASDALQARRDETFGVSLLVPNDSEKFDYQGIDSEIHRWKGPHGEVVSDYGSHAGPAKPSKAKILSCEITINSHRIVISRWSVGDTWYANAFWPNTPKGDHFSLTFSGVQSSVEALFIASVRSVAFVNDPKKLELLAVERRRERLVAIVRNEMGRIFELSERECFAPHFGCVQSIRSDALTVSQGLTDSPVKGTDEVTTITLKPRS